MQILIFLFRTMFQILFQYLPCRTQSSNWFWIWLKDCGRPSGILYQRLHWSLLLLKVKTLLWVEVDPELPFPIGKNTNPAFLQLSLPLIVVIFSMHRLIFKNNTAWIIRYWVLKSVKNNILRQPEKWMNQEGLKSQRDPNNSIRSLLISVFSNKPSLCMNHWHGPDKKLTLRYKTSEFEGNIRNIQLLKFLLSII